MSPLPRDFDPQTFEYFDHPLDLFDPRDVVESGPAAAHQRGGEKMHGTVLRRIYGNGPRESSTTLDLEIISFSKPAIHSPYNITRSLRRPYFTAQANVNDIGLCLKII